MRGARCTCRKPISLFCYERPLTHCCLSAAAYSSTARLAEAAIHANCSGECLPARVLSPLIAMPRPLNQRAALPTHDLLSSRRTSAICRRRLPRLASRRSTASCSTSVCRHLNSMTLREALASCAMARSTCAWTSQAGQRRPTGLLQPHTTN